MKEGEVYIKRLKSGNDAVRRVIAIHNGIVCYSRGSDTNGYCSEDEFFQWTMDGRVEMLVPGDQLKPSVERGT